MPSAAKLWRHVSPDGSEAWHGPYGPESVPEDWVSEEIDRMPEHHERRENGRWVKDLDAEAEEQENARLRGMSEKDRHEDAIKRAKRSLIDDMEAIGMASAAHAKKLRERTL